VGDVVLAEWTITVVQRASGEELVWDGMSRAQYRDGLITQWREYWNPAALAPIAAAAS
jgi:ketosteroid isomerase-like protein